MPAARGAAALVPEWLSVHPVPLRFNQSVVTCQQYITVYYTGYVIGIISIIESYWFKISNY